MIKVYFVNLRQVLFDDSERALISAASARFLFIRYLSAAASELDTVSLLIRLRSVFWLHFALDLASHKGESVLNIKRALG